MYMIIQEKLQPNVTKSCHVLVGRGGVTGTSTALAAAMSDHFTQLEIPVSQAEPRRRVIVLRKKSFLLRKELPLWKTAPILRIISER